MEFNEFKILVKGMKSVYTSPNFLPDGDSVKIWFQLLKDLDYNIANAAIQKYILTNKFPPTIAEIRELSAGVQHGEIADWSEGWETVLMAIRKFGVYQIDKAMESFDPITRQCVERLGFREICMSEKIAVDRANFRTIYEQVQQRKKQDNQLSLPLKELIQGIQMKGVQYESNHLLEEN